MSFPSKDELQQHEDIVHSELADYLAALSASTPTSVVDIMGGMFFIYKD
jgi:hypothetical protein